MSMNLPHSGRGSKRLSAVGTPACFHRQAPIEHHRTTGQLSSSAAQEWAAWRGIQLADMERRRAPLAFVSHTSKADDAAIRLRAAVRLLLRRGREGRPV